MLKYFNNTYYLYYLLVFFSFSLSILLVSIPVIDLCEDQINQELFSDLKSETNGEEWNKKNELDEYINCSLKLNQFDKIESLYAVKLNAFADIYFLNLIEVDPLWVLSSFNKRP